MANDSIEAEIKLVMDAAALRQLPKLPIIAQHNLYRPITRRLRSVYFDTHDLSLRQQGVAVRLRREGRRSLQTIKRAGTSSGGLHQRREWESHTPLNALDFSGVDDPELRDLFARGDLQRVLQPVFETDFRRTQRMLRFGSDQIELAIDRGAVRAGDQSEPICEVELELKAGDVRRLFEVAHALNAALPLRLESRSKAERGYRLFAGAQETPRKARAPQLEPDMTASAAFVRIAESCLAQLQGNEHGLLHSGDIEYVHQMRVAIRRLRSAISVFGGLVPKQASEPVVGQLRWLASELNDARNWDVFVAETLPPIVLTNSEEPGLAWLQQESEAAQSASRARARAAVNSPRYRTMLLTVGQWLVTQAWASVSTPEAMAQSVAAYAEVALSERHKRLRKRGKHLVSLSHEERHAVRIAAKKLRYAAEFFASLFAKREVQPYLAALSKLQDLLGQLNDAATSAGLLALLGHKASSNDEHQALGLVKGWTAGRASRKTDEIELIWHEFNQARRFW